MNKNINIILALLAINGITLASEPRPRFVRDESACEAIAKQIAQIADHKKAKLAACTLEIKSEQLTKNPFCSKEEKEQALRDMQCAEVLRNYKAHFDSNRKFRNFMQGFSQDKSRKEYLESYIDQKMQKAAKDPAKALLTSRKGIINDFTISIKDQIHNPMSSTKEAEQAKEWQAIINSQEIRQPKSDPTDQALKDINAILKQ
jgi:hypothetical protein